MDGTFRFRLADGEKMMSTDLCGNWLCNTVLPDVEVKGKGWKDEAYRYVVYRFPRGERVNIKDASKIVGITNANSFELPSRGDMSTWVVTALDRMSNESKTKKVRHWASPFIIIGFSFQIDLFVFHQFAEEIIEFFVQTLHEISTHNNCIVVSQIELTNILLFIVFQHNAEWFQNTQSINCFVESL